MKNIPDYVIPKEVQITSCDAIVLVGLVKRKPSTHIFSLKGKFPLPGLQFLDLYLLFCPFVRPSQPDLSGFAALTSIHRLGQLFLRALLIYLSYNKSLFLYNAYK